MTIADAIQQGLTVVTVLDEPYTAHVSVTGSIEHVDSVDIKVKSISYPMTRNNVEFDYEYTSKTDRYALGSFRLTKYYPVGSVVKLNGYNVTVLSYGTPVKSRSFWSVSMDGSVDSEIEEAVVTNVDKEDKVLSSLTNILYYNDDIKRLLKYYNGNIIDYIGMNIMDISNAKNLIVEQITAERDIEHGFQSEIEDDIGTTQLNATCTEYANYFNSHILNTKYKLSTFTLNCKAFASWLLRYYIANSYWSVYANVFNNFELVGPDNNNCKIKFDTYSDNSSIIIIYTPSCCQYNIAIYIRSFIVRLGRVYPEIGYAMISKNYTAGSTTSIPFSTIGSVDKWNWIGDVFYNATGNGKSATETLTEYYLNTLPTLLPFISQSPDVTSAVFVRDPLPTTGRLGVLTINNTKSIEV